MKTFVCDKKTRLSKFLLDRFDGDLSFSEFNKLLRKKDVKINGVRCGRDTSVEAGDTVVVYYDGALPTIDQAVFSDENVIVAVKKKGITSEKFFERLKNEYPTLYFCHRLDRNTDGLMLFAKNESAYKEILNAFKVRSFDKFYLCAVYGLFDKKEDVLSAYLKKDADLGIVTVYDKPILGAKPIKTGYRVIAEDKKENVSLIEVRLYTGRTHQIRAHLAHIGHFVLGDGKYGSDKINREKKVSKTMLSAYKMVLHFEKDESLYYLNEKSFEFDCGLQDGFSQKKSF